MHALSIDGSRWPEWPYDLNATVRGDVIIGIRLSAFANRGWPRTHNLRRPSEMRRVNWQDPGGHTQWQASPGLWCGLFGRDTDRDGVYASSRGPMASFMLDGEMEVELGPKRQNLELRPGGGMLIAPRTPFRYRLKGGSRLLVVDLPTKYAPGLGLAPIARAKVPRRLAALLAHRAEAPKEADLRALVQEAATLAVPHLPVEPAHNTARIVRVKDYLDAHFRHGVVLKDVAADHGMGLSYLSRSFAATFGMAPQPYVQHLRQEHFLRGLLTGRGTLEQLAHASGFSDYPSFCRLIRRRLGVAPGQLYNGQTCPSRSPQPG